MSCYLITTTDGFQKIGRTNNIRNRLFALQTGSAKQLRLKSCISSNRSDVLEKALHNRYKVYRRSGEWFELPQEELDKWGIKGFADFDANKQLTVCSNWIQSILDK